MEKEQPKKCFCARCFLPIDAEDKVDIEGQNFHRICSMCCVCRTIPTSIKMFYGHVFCSECFKSHVLGKFRGDAPRMQSSSWWNQWAPGAKLREESTDRDEVKSENSSEPTKKLICSRCLLAVDEHEKVDIGGQHFHPLCAKCYFCQTVPTNNLKIYYGQVFCEDCFHRHVMNRNRDNPAEFFKACFEQWQNAQFAEGMRSFMGGSRDGAPFVFCRCSGQTEWGAQPDTRKSATPIETIAEDSSVDPWDLTFENRTDWSDTLETSTEHTIVAAAEKIEKLTKYLQHRSLSPSAGKKLKNFVVSDKISLTSYKGWGEELEELEEPEVKPVKFECPKCLWQCGPIYVQSDLWQQCGAFQ